MPRFGARPQASEAITNSTMDVVNRRTAPKRWVSQPVSGTAIALATANEVMTQVPWLVDTPTSPEMAGIETLAIEVSSTFMNVASDRATVPINRAEPSNGGCGMKGRGTTGGVASIGLSLSPGVLGIADINSQKNVNAPPRGTRAH